MSLHTETSESLLALSPCHTRTQQEGDCLPAWERAPTRSRPCWYPDLGLPASRIERNKGLLLKPPSLGIVMAAEQTNTVGEKRSLKLIFNHFSGCRNPLAGIPSTH